MKKVLFYWLFSASIVTFVCLACYSTAQQLSRQSADDVPAQLARDTAYALDHDAAPDSLVADKVDIANSLSPFILIYDESKTVIASSALLVESSQQFRLEFLTKFPRRAKIE